MREINFQFFRRLPEQERKITFSTWFTIARIVLAPIIIGVMIAGCWGAAFGLFLAAASTDVIDGYLARTLGEQTMLGAYLDPLADKILVLSCFTTLAFVQSPLFTIPLWFLLVVLCKEIILIVGFFVVYFCYGHVQVRPTVLGKLTTLIQIGFIIWLFACYFFHWVPLKTYYTMLALMLMTVFASLLQYIFIGFSLLRNAA